MPHAAAGSSSARAAPSGLGDVVDLMLDRGVVADVYTRAILTDLEFGSLDGRVVMASFDTYLRGAVAVDRPAAATPGPAEEESPVD